MKNRCIVIIGPTAVGKTAVSLALAQQFPIEIINGDMAQMYTPLSIGTAKPSLQERETIPHHLFDILNEPRSYSVVEYRARVQQLIHDIVNRGKIPVIVGGSSFYIRSLFFKIDGSQTAPLLNESLYASSTTAQLWNRLFEIDAQRAAQIDPNDRYRIVRALSIWDSSGKKPSAFRPQFNPVADSFAVVELERTKEDLAIRIRARIDQMMQTGFLEEVCNLSDEWKQFVRIKKIIGYPEVLAYFEGRCQNSKQLQDMIALHTQQYVKKQNTFNKAFVKQLEQYAGQISVFRLNLTISDDSLYIEQLAREIVRVL